MKTEDLLTALRKARGATLSSSIYPIFSHFCFERKYIYTYNDVCAILVYFPTDLNCGVPVDVLLGILPTMPAEIDLTFDPEESALLIEGGRAMVKVSTLAPDAFLFTPPKDEAWAISLENLNEPFFTGLSRCAAMVGGSALHREFTGVCFEVDPNSEMVTLLSTDDVRLSEFRASSACLLKARTRMKTSYLLPAEGCNLFCEAWGAQVESGSAETMHLCINNDWAMLVGDGVLVYCKVMPDEPPDYSSILKAISPSVGGAVWQGVPEEFKALVRRAEVLVQRDPTAALIFEMEVKTLHATLADTEGPPMLRVGEFEEEVPFGKVLVPDGGKLRLAIGTDRLIEAVDLAEEIRFSSRCMGLRAGMFSCWVAPKAE